MLCAHDIGVTFAIALLLKSKTRQRRTKNVYRCWGCDEVRCFEYGLYMFCIAYMMCAYDVAEQFAIALSLIARNKKIQRNVRACVCELFSCCRILFIYVLRSMYDLCE